ncbi:hypothetical protein JOB18_009736 [Solea senegalensis]|uniref:Translin-associated factor X-interacting protein 1 N-terminal domain-containing protein n=2 Tax=Solea senegalensis TaxID=28829 RepID=A0AAV6SYV8_SOLSE|nr:translin-associated factor X-interacting protein 1 isoform X1 [Solea senegalensis]KAG7521923.1 hypothetical protein JOB18_009736 [Solea senegalensis]
MSCDAKPLTQDFPDMSPHKHIKFPPLAPLQNQSDQNDCNSGGERDGGCGVTGVVTDQAAAARKLCFSGSSHIYAGTDRKPRLLMYMESYLNKELHSISPQEPKYQELKLQVHRDIFGCYIKEFQTYQPILSAIRKEYENMLAYQQDQIQELEPLRSHLRLVREECERKIQARWGEERAEIGALKREKQQLQRDIEAMRENEKATQTVVEHVQRELSKQYLRYREERDARRLLIGQLSDLTRATVKTETPAGDNAEEDKDPVELQLALKVCRVDLTRAQEELSKMKAEYWDVVPRRNWDTLEETHKQTLLQLHTLQADFNQVKSEYDTLLELHNNRGDVKVETLDSTSVQQLETSDEPALPPALDQSEENAESNDFPASN